MELEKKLYNLQKEYAANEQQVQSAFNVMADQLAEARKRIAILEELLRGHNEGKFNSVKSY